MKKPLNYYGYAFEKPGKGYNKKFLKTKEGKEELKREMKAKKKLRKQLRQTGVDTSEVWNLDITIAKFVLPRIKLLRETTHGYPPNLTYEQWLNILTKMELAFQLTADNALNADTQLDHEIGLALFAQYFSQLWD